MAQGNGYQAGSGALYSFNAVFTGSYTVAAPGDVAFNFYSDDGFIFGAGGGAVRVGGADWNPPASGVTPFEGYPVMGAYNGPTSPVANQVTVHFPAAGVYLYEIDYSECCGGQLVLTTANAASGLGVPPTGSLSLSPTSVTARPIGQAQSFTVQAMDVSGAPVADLPVTLIVSGANSLTLTATTDAAGLADFSYTGQTVGTDEVEANAAISALPAVSNAVAVPWLAAPPAPVIGAVSPPEGTVVTAPVPIGASITPPAGQTIASWSVSRRCAGATSDTAIASGSGDPPATLATFDPTLLPNGACVVTVSATASGGGTQSTTLDLVVDGALKLGRYELTYQDLSVPIGGIPIQVLRTYDSFDKSAGDFGVGWRLQLSDFRVSTNGPLGAGGWSQYNTSCALFLCTTAFATSAPHYVTVTWPNGHQEIFDFTPDGGSNLFWFGTPRFTGRPGTTSTLAIVGVSNVAYGGDGNLYAGVVASGSPLDPVQFTLTAKDGTVYLLDRNLGLISATDRNGNTVTVNATGIHSSLGPSVSFTRDAAGRISAITDPAGKTISYATDAAGDLTAVTDQDGHTVTYSYDTAHDLLLAKDPAGHPIRTLTYGPDGRLASVTDGAGNTTTISDDVAGRQEVVTSPDGALTTIATFDDRGDPLQIDQVTGGRTLTTRYTYDTLGHVLSKTDPLGHGTTLTWDAAGNPTSVTVPGGGMWSFAYNSFGQVTSVTDPAGAQSEAFGYDGAGNLITQTFADGTKDTYGYDPAGWLTSMTDANTHTTTYGASPTGQVTSVTTPDGRTTTYGYDADGGLQTTTDPTGATTTFGYDAAGNLTSVTDALGHTRSYTYDYAENVTSMTDPDGHTATYTYDAAGRLASATDRDGQTTTYGYDVFGNVTSVTLPDGSVSSYTYDPLGRLTEADNPDATLTFTYDDAGSLTGQTSAGTATSSQPTVTLGFGRDAAGRLASVTAPWGTTTLSYDADSRLSQLVDPASGSFGFGYDPLGRLTSLTRPNGVDDVLAYDPAGQLLSRTSSVAGTVIDTLSYTYDSAGRRTSRTDAFGTMTYTYDGADRLLQSLAPAGSGLPSETFTYDAAGNRTSGSATYDGADRLLSDAKYDYTYDADGNLVSKTDRSSGQVTHYAWNALGELTSTTLPSGATIRYRYDALGRRIELAGPSGTTRYVNLGANVVAEYDGSNTLQASYVVTPSQGDLPGAALESQTGATSTYTLFDGVGSVTAITDASGAISARYSYAAFGAPVGTSSGTYAFGTYGYDTTSGLYAARSRYYDPTQGRFLSEDPIATVNPYPYAAADPVAGWDPSGAQAFFERATVVSTVLGTALGGFLNVLVYGVLAPKATVDGAVQSFINGALAGGLTGLGLGGIGALGPAAAGLAALALKIELGLLISCEGLVVAYLEGRPMNDTQTIETFAITTVIVTFSPLPVGGLGEQFLQSFKDWTFWVGVGEAGCSAKGICP